MNKGSNEWPAVGLTALLAVLLGGGVVALGTDSKKATDPRTMGADTAAAPRVEPLAAQRLGQSAQGATGRAPEALRLIGRGRDGIWPCAECHRPDGAGNGPIPRLAGLPAGYLAKQLHDFRAGLRRHATMERVASALTDEEILALAEHFAALETPSNAGPRLGGDLDRGRTLAYVGDWSVDVPACFSCHGSLAWGVEDLFPPLAAQHPVYTVRQLDAWIDGSRANAPLGLMHAIASGLSRRDREAVADFLATLPAPPAHEPSSTDRENPDATDT